MQRAYVRGACTCAYAHVYMYLKDGRWCIASFEFTHTDTHNTHIHTHTHTQTCHAWDQEELRDALIAQGEGKYSFYHLRYRHVIHACMHVRPACPPRHVFMMTRKTSGSNPRHRAHLHSKSHVHAYLCSCMYFKDFDGVCWHPITRTCSHSCSTNLVCVVP